MTGHGRWLAEPLQSESRWADVLRCLPRCFSSPGKEDCRARTVTATFDLGEKSCTRHICAGRLLYVCAQPCSRYDWITRKNRCCYESRIPNWERKNKFRMLKMIEAAAFDGEVPAQCGSRRIDSCIPKKRWLLALVVNTPHG